MRKAALENLSWRSLESWLVQKDDDVWWRRRCLGIAVMTTCREKCRIVQCFVHPMGALSDEERDNRFPMVRDKT